MTRSAERVGVFSSIGVEITRPVIESNTVTAPTWSAIDTASDDGIVRARTLAAPAVAVAMESIWTPDGTLQNQG